MAIAPVVWLMSLRSVAGGRDVGERTAQPACSCRRCDLCIDCPA